MSVDTTTEEPQADSGEAPSEDADRGRGLILIVDDDRNHAEGSRDVLEMVGFRCDVATSGAVEPQITPPADPMAIALDRESSDSTDVAHIAVGARQMPTALMSRS